jgi:hypothetical protein
MATTASEKPMSKTEIVAGIASATGLTKKQVSGVFEAMADQIKKSLGRRGPGAYTVPGLMKLMVVRSLPPRRARASTPSRRGAMFKPSRRGTS